MNVLRGHMSLIGPRPERPEIAAQLARAIEDYNARSAVLPGITGHAQVHLPPDTSVADVRDKVRLDRYYLGRLSIWFDLVTLARTGLKVVGLYRTVMYLRPPASKPETGRSSSYDWKGLRHAGQRDRPGAERGGAHPSTPCAGSRDQDFPAADYEILVVDGVSDDGTADIVRELQRPIPNLHLLDNPKRLASAGAERRRATRARRVRRHRRRPLPGPRPALPRASSSRRSKRAGRTTLGRPQPLRADQPTAFQRAVAAARTSWLGHNPDSAHLFGPGRGSSPPDNVAVAYRREVFDRVGLFDESFDACEDVEFNTRVRRAGLTCYFTPAIAVEYQPRATLGGLFYQMCATAAAGPGSDDKHPATLTLPSLVPPLWLLWLAAGVDRQSGVAVVRASRCTASIALYAGGYSRRVGARVAGRTGRIATTIAAGFAAIHLGFGVGILARDWPR